MRDDRGAVRVLPVVGASIDGLAGVSVLRRSERSRSGSDEDDVSDPAQRTSVKVKKARTSTRAIDVLVDDLIHPRPRIDFDNSPIAVSIGLRRLEAFLRLPEQFHHVADLVILVLLDRREAAREQRSFFFLGDTRQLVLPLRIVGAEGVWGEMRSDLAVDVGEDAVANSYTVRQSTDLAI